MQNRHITVIKRDGTREPFNFDKIWEHVKYATEGLKCEPTEIISNFKLRVTDNVSSQDIQENLIKSCADLISEENSDYQYAASRLLLQDLYKRVYGNFKPVFNSEVLKDRIAKGYYDPEIFRYYSPEEIDSLIKVIDFEKDKNFTYLGLTQMMKKYLIKRNKYPVETPQEVYFLIPLYVFARIEDRFLRKWYVEEMYKALSDFAIFLPTPDMAGIRSKMRGFTSCAGINIGDSIESIANASKWMFHLITELRAGIGANIGHIRGMDAEIRGGEEVHTGIIPYVQVFEHIALSSQQPNTGRKGSTTFYYPFFHWEIEDILVLKNNKGSEEARARKTDHAIVFDSIVWDRAEKDEDITLFHINDVPELYEKIGTPEFKTLYEKYEKELPQEKKKSIKAKELLRKYRNERYTTNRIYKTNADAMQQQSAFKVPVYTSNLCVAGDTKIEIKVEGKEFAVPIKELENLFGEKEVFVKSKNLETGKIEYKKITAFAMTSPEAEVMEIKYKTSSLVLTPEHKVYTKNRGYLEARDLFVTDTLDTDSNMLISSMVVKGFLEEKIPVYDITVEDNHNFYANGILVHNCTEIALPSFPDQNFVYKVKSPEEMQNFIESLYEGGQWYQLYRYVMYGIKDENNIAVIDRFNSLLDENGKEFTLNFGEIFACILGGINFGKLSKNVDKRRRQFKLWMKLLVRFLDEKIDYQEYFGIKPFERFSKNRRALGISPGNLFYLLAKHGYSHETQEARDLIHGVMEEFLYYGLKASNELAKEKGACKWFKDTKYSDGLTPVDWYNKNVDRLVTSPELKLDWEGLKKSIKEYGLRNSTLLTAVPSSNSSRPANMISGINPPKGLYYVVEDDIVKVQGLLPDLKKYKEFYIKNLAFNIDIISYWKLVAIIQKFTDQAISLNEYIDYTKFPNGKIPFVEVLKREYFTIKYGIKTNYYIISKTEDHSKNDVLTGLEDGDKNESLPGIDYDGIEEDGGCAGGACTL